MTGDTDRAADVTAPSYVDVSNVLGVIRLAYGSTGRHLLRLLVPVVVVLVPVSVVLGVLLLAVVGRGGLVVDGDLAPVEVTPVLGVAIIAVLLVWFAACLVVLAAMVVMSAGLLLGRPVRAGAALRAVVRRPVALAVLGVTAVLPGVLSLAAGVAVAVMTGSPWPAGAAAVVVPAALLWLAHGLPVAFLEGRGAWRSIGRAWSLTRQRRTRDAVAVTLGLLAGPALFTYGVQWALSPLAGAAHTVLGSALTGAASLLVIPFQAMTLTVATLNRQYPYGATALDEQRPLDPGPIAGRLPGLGTGGRPRTRWAVPLVAALVLPGLLYGGYVRLNPLGLPADHVIKEEFGTFSVALRMLPGDRPMAIDDTYLTVRACGDPGCATVLKHDYSGPVDHGETGSVTLPDGTVAATAWYPLPYVRKGLSLPHWGLRLLRCGTRGCGSVRAAEHAPIVARGEGAEYEYASAMTVTRDGILIATLQPDPETRSAGLIRLVRCADARCATPHAVTVAHLPSVDVGLQSRPLAVAAGADGRPVIAYADAPHAGVTVVSCDGAECRHPRTTRPVPWSRESLRSSLYDRYLDGVDLEVPPDGRPVLTYHEMRTGAARLLRCRTRDCARADDRALTGPDPWRSRPALALDRDGRPLVATYDRGKVELIACDDAGCAHRRNVTLAELRNGSGYLDLALTHDGRPVVLWSEASPKAYVANAEGPLHLTTCARPRCGA